MGPGTHIISNIENGVQPTSYTDALALSHDINYLIATGDHYKMRRADEIAIGNAPYNTQGMLMKLVLFGRYALGLKESEGIDNKYQNIATGYKLKYEVLNEPEWQAVRRILPENSFL